MTRRVIFEGGLVQVIDENVLMEGSIEDALPFLENRPPVTSPILPENNVRAMTYDESEAGSKKLEILLQLPPLVRTLEYDAVRTGNPCLVAVPYTLLFIRAITRAENPRGQDWNLDYMRIYWSKEPVKTLDQKLIPAVLPNIYTDGRICFWTAGTNANQSLADRLDETLNSFYLTGFTNHHVRDYEWPWRQKDYLRWAQETKDKGLAAYRDIPEFDTLAAHKVIDLFQTKPEPGIIVLPDGIPQLEFTPTFGRAEEWVADLNDDQVDRLARAIEIRREARAAAVQA